MSIITADANAVNFREIFCGNIAPKTLFRSSHPIPGGEQEPVIAMLAAQNRIAAVINLSDTVSALKQKTFFAPWYNRLFINNKVIALGMGFNVTGDSYNQKLKKALRFIIKTESPWLIHCHAGIDRTGFVAMVIEALMGAAIDAIAGDYLKSFNSIFESSMYDHSTQFDCMRMVHTPPLWGDIKGMYPETNTLPKQPYPVRSAAGLVDLPVVMRLLSVLSGSLTISDQNLQDIAEQYLGNKIGLSAEEISALKMKLSKGT